MPTCSALELLPAWTVAGRRPGFEPSNAFVVHDRLNALAHEWDTGLRFTVAEMWDRNASVRQRGSRSRGGPGQSDNDRCNGYAGC